MGHIEHLESRRLLSTGSTLYARGRYERKLKYDQPPPLRVPEDDRQWLITTALAAGN